MEIAENGLIIKSFNPIDGLPRLRCGKEEIDTIYSLYTEVFHRESKGVTTLFYREGDLVGFCILLADRLSITSTEPLSNGQYPGYYPALQLYSIGVKRELQSQGLGREMIEWIIFQAYEMRKTVGITFIVLEAFNDPRLIKFYEDCGFEVWDKVERTEDDLVPMVFDFREL
ncbi:GNAT family N-acetyltransferase [Terribacillus sp. 7520-G]|uniref:GNAT family N-acetyltransferase n=1 Tax=Terribacillus sp. 7520-G TaxID=2025389 RepID=UPI000BA7C777|nr:GNAT family N-acetyltransferase [Terribacillus sp. 7520-G]PAD39830.1 hypothetical protein CHH53_04100 [Terribacillus sp. 7520-G]